MNHELAFLAEELQFVQALDDGYLTRIINDGTASLGGSMPAWSDKLSAEEIASILNWVTSLWPADVYETWVTRGGLTN